VPQSTQATDLMVCQNRPEAVQYLLASFTELESETVDSTVYSLRNEFQRTNLVKTPCQIRGTPPTRKVLLFFLPTCPHDTRLVHFPILVHGFPSNDLQCSMSLAGLDTAAHHWAFHSFGNCLRSVDVLTCSAVSHRFVGPLTL
jgi:hypothetical protein